MYNHNKAQQSKIRVYISWDILYVCGKENVLSFFDQNNYKEACIQLILLVLSFSLTFHITC